MLNFKNWETVNTILDFQVILEDLASEVYMATTGSREPTLPSRWGHILCPTVLSMPTSHIYNM